VPYSVLPCARRYLAVPLGAASAVSLSLRALFSRNHQPYKIIYSIEHIFISIKEYLNIRYILLTKYFHKRYILWYEYGHG
jgi:hypothetical protein